MFARISRYEVAPERIEETVESFRAAAQKLLDLDGLQYGQLLVDRDSGGLATVTVWGNRQAMEDSRTRAGSLRRQAVGAGEGTVVSVSEYEVAFDFRP